MVVRVVARPCLKPRILAVLLRQSRHHRRLWSPGSPLIGWSSLVLELAELGFDWDAGGWTRPANLRRHLSLRCDLCLEWNCDRAPYLKKGCLQFLVFCLRDCSVRL